MNLVFLFPMQRKIVFKPKQITYSAAKLTTIRRTQAVMLVSHFIHSFIGILPNHFTATETRPASLAVFFLTQR